MERFISCYDTAKGKGGQDILKISVTSDAYQLDFSNTLTDAARVRISIRGSIPSHPPP